MFQITTANNAFQH